MTATNHVLAGAVIAASVKKPELAIPLAFISHFVMDGLPHFHPSQVSSKLAQKIAYSDAAVAIFLSLVLLVRLKAGTPGWLILTCAFLAVSPDFVWVWRYYKLKNLEKVFSEPMSWFSRFHEKIQWSESQLGGGLVELGWFVLLVILVRHLS